MEYFGPYFSEEFFQDAVQFTNMYSVEKTGKSLNTTVAEVKRFFGINLLMGCINYPRLRMYWKRGYNLPAVSDVMSRDRFHALRNSFHLVDVNNPPNNENKLWKVQPVIDSVRNVCLQLPRNNVSFSIDEQMIPFTGRCSLRQYVKNKPRPVGLKNFLLTTSYGLVLDFEIYQGKSTRLGNFNLGLGSNVVLRLIETLPQNSSVYFDRYFTTIPLLETLSEMGVEGSGTILPNRIKGIKFESNDKLNRGESIEHVSSDGKIVVVQWKDNKSIIMASTCTGIYPEHNLLRYSKHERQRINVPAPAVVRLYNQNMGGVDICDQLMEYYRTWFKTRKWTWKVILHFLDLALVNAWVQYIFVAKSNRMEKKKIKDLLQFKLEVAEALVATSDLNRSVLDSDEDEEEPRAKRSKFFNPPSKMPCGDKRYDGYEHFPAIDDISTPRMCRNENCKGRTKINCIKCKVYLCLSKNKNCFKDFHYRN